MRVSCLLPSAFCLLPSAYCLLLTVLSEFVFVVIIVQVFFDNVQFYRIESDNFKLDTAFLTGNTFAFIYVGVHVDIGIALGTCSSRHFFTSSGVFPGSGTHNTAR
jgi:hypothetical protein